MITAASDSSGTNRRAAQYLLSALKAASDQGGIEIADRTTGNQTFEAPLWSVLGSRSHCSGSPPIHGRRPLHLVTS